jgi:putative DNA primase/helicase
MTPEQEIERILLQKLIEMSPKAYEKLTAEEWKDYAKKFTTTPYTADTLKDLADAKRAEEKTKPRGKKTPTVEVTLQSYDEIPKEHLEFLWPGYLALGKLIHLAGNSGEGKSPLTCDLAARISRGAEWPDKAANTLGPRSVILLAAEDDPSDTIRPRLEQAGADLTKIHQVKATVKTEQSASEKMLALSTDLAALLTAARTIKDLALIVIDPITNYLGAGVKMNQEEDVRAVLMPLALGAKDLCITALTVGHFNKREHGTESLQRIMGAAAFHGVARFIYLVGADPEDTDKFAHVLVQRRGGDAPSLRYKTFAKPVEWLGKVSSVVGVEWRGVSQATAQDAVDPELSREKSTVEKAGEELAAILKDGKKKRDEALELLAGAGFDTKRLNTTRLLQWAGAKTKRFPGEKFYSWYLPTMYRDSESGTAPEQSAFKAREAESPF